MCSCASAKDCINYCVGIALTIDMSTPRLQEVIPEDSDHMERIAAFLDLKESIRAFGKGGERDWRSFIEHARECLYRMDTYTEYAGANPARKDTHE